MSQTPLTKAVTCEVWLSRWRKNSHTSLALSETMIPNHKWQIYAFAFLNIKQLMVEASEIRHIVPQILQNMQCGVFPGVATLPQRPLNLSKHLFFPVNFLAISNTTFYFQGQLSRYGDKFTGDRRTVVRFSARTWELSFFPKNLGLYSGLRSPLFPWVKAADPWSWSITKFSAEVTNEWSYTSTPPYAFRANTGTFCCHLSVYLNAKLYLVSK